MSLLKIEYFAEDKDEFTEPTSAYDDDAGYDLYSAETITILPRTCEGVNCKFITAIPRGYYGQICSRSSLVENNLITAEGGVIDSGYRGQWFVILINHGKECFNVVPGDKIAQVIFIKKETVEFVRVKRIEQLELSKRVCARFGSSGKKRKKIAFVEPSPSTSDDIDDNNDDNEITESEGLIFIE